MARLLLLSWFLLLSTAMMSQYIDMTEGYFEACKGIFRDPGGAGDYSNDLYITTTICSVVEGSPLQIHFNSFISENGFDALTVFNGDSADGEVLGSLTGTMSDVDFCATSGCMTFIFVTDFSVIGAGWEAEIGCTECGPTGDVFPMANDRVSTCDGIFTDTGVGENYMDNEDFVKTICAAYNDVHVIVAFQTIILENSFDYLTIYDGPTVADPMLASLTGSYGPLTYTSTENCLTFKFTSDFSVTQQGWEATISCTEPPQSADEIAEIPFSCYPNPSTGVFTLQPELSEVYDFQVYNIAGECILQKSKCIGNQLIDMKGYPIGCYILEVKSDQHAACQKLFLQ